MPLGCLPLIIFLWLLLLLPYFLADVMFTALGKLGLSVGMSFYAVFWIFFGGFINIPIKKIQLPAPQEYLLFPFFGLDRIIQKTRQSRFMIIAVNLGGCIVPLVICAYEIYLISRLGLYAVTACLIATGINVVVCYKFSKPIPQVGITMPPLIPAVVAAICGLVLLPEFAAPIAFTAGVLGPIIGADLMRLKQVGTINTAMVSIGGAGTFDGIVISGLCAALLA